MRKNVIKSYKMLDAASLAAAVTSSEVNVLNLDEASIFVEWTGSSVNGVLKLQAKNAADGDWIDLDFAAPINLATNSGSHILVLTIMPHYALQLVYTPSAGTGTLDATIVAKTVGA